MTSARIRRRRLGVGIVLLALLVAGLLVANGTFHHAAREISLPLRYDDIIRQQAVESRFIAGRTSPAGAEGLMQITPETARDIARRSGGTRFTVADLDTPQINISYGSYLLRELLDRYDGDLAAALAAYNAGPGNADKWGGSSLKAQDIPFPETRAYVEKVLRAQEDYRARYAKELGPAP